MSTFTVHLQLGPRLVIEADEMMADTDGLFFHKKGADGVTADVLVAAVRDWAYAVIEPQVPA